ncbi:conserved hypothetical protein [Culex quinquefasciatus]|uniref:Uncharacterized protein n=1 Tax=Culex quinquefasciatus TaxID=7176 RepID=B0WZC9_CULQU|nr:conserved hypothetical protein [Culex quinquefasciatus]|eukprot:XP_001862751.1 conserved hypothetical protein [Culex quinquefasciatus]
MFRISGTVIGKGLRTYGSLSDSGESNESWTSGGSVQPSSVGSQIGAKLAHEGRRVNSPESRSCKLGTPLAVARFWYSWLRAKFVSVRGTMAPFKLRFRMGSGSSRSASQEQDVVVDSQANQMIVQTNSYLSSSGNNTAAYGSSTTLDSEQNNDSLVSMSNDQRALIRDRDSPDERIGNRGPSLLWKYYTQNRVAFWR